MAAVTLLGDRDQVYKGLVYNRLSRDEEIISIKPRLGYTHLEKKHVHFLTMSRLCRPLLRFMYDFVTYNKASFITDVRDFSGADNNSQFLIIYGYGSNNNILSALTLKNLTSGDASGMTFPGGYQPRADVQVILIGTLPLKTIYGKQFPDWRFDVSIL